MADIELIIKISNYDKEWITNGYCIPEEINMKISEAIANSTPLPKGHGDMVDRDAINRRFYEIWKELESYSNKPSYKDLLDKLSMCLDTALPIIEADMESEE